MNIILFKNNKEQKSVFEENEFEENEFEENVEI